MLTVFPWSVTVLDEWLSGYRDLFPTAAGGSSLWPTERGARLSLGALSDRFAAYRDQLGLPTELGLHCLRHSYVTHLIEAGYDAHFVQQQVGHSHASTTALYTSVSSDYRTRTLRRVSRRDRGCCPGDPTSDGVGVREETRWPASLISGGTCASSWPRTTSGRPRS